MVPDARKPCSRTGLWQRRQQPAVNRGSEAEYQSFVSSAPMCRRPPCKVEDSSPAFFHKSVGSARFSRRWRCSVFRNRSKGTPIYSSAILSTIHHTEKIIRRTSCFFFTRRATHPSIGGIGRCVVMVGLPYPDKRDPELKQKMAYLDKADPGR